MTQVKNETETRNLNKKEVDIIVNALLHEMQTYNKALDLVSDKQATEALETAKNKVFNVFMKMNTFTTEEE